MKNTKRKKASLHYNIEGYWCMTSPCNENLFRTYPEFQQHLFVVHFAENRGNSIHLK